jgi:SseB protein N-terminal domain
MTGNPFKSVRPQPDRDPAHLADSAGTPWSGRLLTSTGFDGDKGEADPELLRALADRARRPSAETDARLVEVAGPARWIVPVVALLAEGQRDSHGQTVDKSTDMAVVTLTSPDGRRALPVFTSVAALAAWQPDARPVPVDGTRAASAALAEGCQVVVVDLGSDQVQELRSSQLWAMARRQPWLPAHTDPIVAQAVSEATHQERDLHAYRLEESSSPGSGQLRVVLTLRPGLTAEDVQALLARVGARLAENAEFRMRVDELAFALETGATP